MVATTYTLKAFNYNMAMQGKLCVVVLKDYNGGSIDSSNTSFIKACVCSPASNNECSVTIYDIPCFFDRNGFPISTQASNYKLMMGSAGIEVQQYGNAIKRAQMVKTIKTSRGVETQVLDYPVTNTKRASSTTEDGEPEKNVMVSALNARDNFALRALQCIIPTLPDLRNIGDDERDYWCKMAYDWAANMMDNAAQVRATFEDQTTSTEQSTDITELETNTDKLLNNMLFTMERAQKITVDGGTEVVSERVTTPDLTEALQAQTASIVSAINSIKAAITDQTGVLNSIKDAITAQTTNINLGLGTIARNISNLELSPVINNNITIPENSSENQTEPIEEA